MDFIEARMDLRQSPPKEIYIHTADPDAASRMNATLKRIDQKLDALKKNKP